MSRLAKAGLIAAGIVLAVLIALIWAAVSWGQGELQAQQADAADYGQWAVQEIGANWDPLVLKREASAEFLGAAPFEQAEEWTAGLKQLLGPVVSVAAASAEVDVKKIRGQDALVGVYLTQAKFQKGAAEVKLTLTLKERGGWQIASINLRPEGGKPSQAGASEASSAPSASPGR